jgi:hypothetical protein
MGKRKHKVAIKTKKFPGRYAPDSQVNIIAWFFGIAGGAEKKQFFDAIFARKGDNHFFIGFGQHIFIVTHKLCG